MCCWVGAYIVGTGLTHHDKLAGNVFDALDAVVVLALAESLRVDIGGEVAYCGSDAFVEGAAESEVPAETHAGCALARCMSATMLTIGTRCDSGIL